MHVQHHTSDGLVLCSDDLQKSLQYIVIHHSNHRKNILHVKTLTEYKLLSDWKSFTMVLSCNLNIQIGVSMLEWPQRLVTMGLFHSLVLLFIKFYEKFFYRCNYQRIFCVGAMSSVQFFSSLSCAQDTQSHCCPYRITHYWWVGVCFSLSKSCNTISDRRLSY